MYAMICVHHQIRKKAAYPDGYATIGDARVINSL
jgi:hypothetical protein